MTKTVKHEHVFVQDIELDRDNPRIRKFLEMYEGEEISHEQFRLALGAANDEEGDNSATFEKLKNSILTNGGIIQPVILNRRADGTLVCVEGNTRVVLYQGFIIDGVKGDWTHIPALVYEDMSAEEIDAIRLQVHLVGTRAWDPYSKAKYLSHLRNNELMPFERIVEFSGGRKKEVIESINAFSDMEGYYRPILDDDTEFDTRSFSGFVELQKPGIKEAILSTGFTLTNFSEWIRDEKLKPLNTIRSLPRILKNSKARELFLKKGKGAKDALQVLERPDVSKALAEAEIGALAQALAQAIYELPFPQADRLRAEPSSETAQYLSEAAAALAELLKQPSDS